VLGDRNATRVARQACHDIARDFPLWLNTQHVWASVGKPAEAGATTSVDDDPPRRYEMMEYRNGPMVGHALLDTKLGRIWMLVTLPNSGDKLERVKFEEISVENLWESDDEASDRVADAHTDDMRKFWSGEEQKLSRLKDLTRPMSIQPAEQQAEKDR
jgi:hypothetical protein